MLRYAWIRLLKKFPEYKNGIARMSLKVRIWDLNLKDLLLRLLLYILDLIVPVT